MSFNPVKDTFYNNELYGSSQPMTQSGTLAKIASMFAALGLGAGLGLFVINTQPTFIGLCLGSGFLLALVCGMVTVFAPHTAKYSALPYALGQGLTLSIMSYALEGAYPGIAVTAVTLSAATALAMLLLYRLEIIKVTETLRSILLTATAAIGITYLLVFLFGLIGVNTTPFYEDASLISIGFSLFVVGIAAFNLLLDFDLIEKGAERGLPKFMEWYAAFSLMVTLIWLYLEIVRLLIKVSRRR